MNSNNGKLSQSKSINKFKRTNPPIPKPNGVKCISSPKANSQNLKSTDFIMKPLELDLEIASHEQPTNLQSSRSNHGRQNQYKKSYSTERHNKQVNKSPQQQSAATLSNKNPQDAHFLSVKTPKVKAQTKQSSVFRSASVNAGNQIRLNSHLSQSRQLNRSIQHSQGSKCDFTKYQDLLNQTTVKEQHNFYQYWKKKAYDFLDKFMKISDENIKLKKQLTEAELAKKSQGFPAVKSDSNDDRCFQKKCAIQIRQLMEKVSELERQIKAKDIKISMLEEQTLEIGKKLHGKLERNKLLEKLHSQIQSLKDENYSLRHREFNNPQALNQEQYYSLNVREPEREQNMTLNDIQRKIYKGQLSRRYFIPKSQSKQQIKQAKT